MHKYRSFRPSPVQSFLHIYASLLWLLCHSFSATAAPPVSTTVDKIRALENSANGTLGVYVKNLQTGEEITYRAAHKWYLASLVKVPLAIAVLKAVENQDLSLSDRLELRESDYVDGTGDLLFAEPGSRHSVADLIKKSIEDSDSTATDMLMRTIRVEQFNRQVTQMMGTTALGPFTTILQVRYDAYGELHPSAQSLSNTDYVEIRSANDYPARVAAFRKKLKLDTAQLKTSTLEEAFARYYQRDLNTGTLTAMGALLERLVRGELLNQPHTERVLEHMENVTTGNKRLQAGLPAKIAFAQKTGTQINRACNMGITNPSEPAEAVVIVVCAADFGELEHAETTFASLAKILVEDGRVH